MWAWPSTAPVGNSAKENTMAILNSIEQREIFNAVSALGGTATRRQLLVQLSLNHMAASIRALRHRRRTRPSPIPGLAMNKALAFAGAKHASAGGLPYLSPYLQAL